MSHACHRFWRCYKNLHVLLTFGNAQNPLHLPHQTTSERPKVVRDRKFLTLLTSKCGSRHNGVHFFDMSTSKSGPGMVCFFYILTWKYASRHNGVHFFDISTFNSGLTLMCFGHFDFETCFALQLRALFRHRNFQKWSEADVFCTLLLPNVLRATTACNFSSLIWPDGSAPAALASLLFDPREPQMIWKTKWIATCLSCAHLHVLSSDSFFWLFLFSFSFSFSSLSLLFLFLFSSLSLLFLSSLSLLFLFFLFSFSSLSRLFRFSFSSLSLLFLFSSLSLLLFLFSFSSLSLLFLFSFSSLSLLSSSPSASPSPSPSLLFSSLTLLWLFPPLLFHLSILSEVWLLDFLRL